MSDKLGHFSLTMSNLSDYCFSQIILSEVGCKNSLISTNFVGSISFSRWGYCDLIIKGGKWAIITLFSTLAENFLICARDLMIRYRYGCLGEVAEWSIALDLKSSNQQWFVGSNPTLSVLNQLNLDSGCPIVRREGKLTLPSQ